MVGPFAPSESGLESVIQRSVDEDLNRRDEVDVIGGRPVAASTQVCVSRVVRSRTPLSAHNVIGSVVIHGKHVLLREDVAIRLQCEGLAEHPQGWCQTSACSNGTLGGYQLSLGH